MTETLYADRTKSVYFEHRKIIYPERHEMITPPNDLVFILIKPLAMADVEMSIRIMDTLAEHGDIEHAQTRILTTRSDIEQHYKGSAGMMYHPPLVHYLADQSASHFILRDRLKVGEREGSFADYLRADVIGPSNPENTSSDHIRNWVLQHNLEHKVEVNVPATEVINGYTTAFDNLVHCSDSTTSALQEICNWYAGNPEVIQYYSDEFEQLLRTMELR